jgi:adenine-specific DNA-methyltransferase
MMRKICRIQSKIQTLPLFQDNRLIYGDCLNVLPQLREVVCDELSCIFISPPFNSEFNARYYVNTFEHSEYLSFMKDVLSQLYLLLNDNGMLWIHLDEHYSHYIKIQLDTLFGRKQFLTELVYHCPDRVQHFQYTPFYPQCERILVYSKAPIQLIRQKFLAHMSNTNTFLSDLWIRNSDNLEKEGNIDFLGGKMPESILKVIIELSTQKNDYVLDCFAGSGSFGRCAHKLGRKWILVEKIKETFEKLCHALTLMVDGKDPYGISKEVYYSGGGSFEVFHNE